MENLSWLYVGVAVEGNGTRSAQKCGPGGKRRVENCGQILSQPCKQAAAARPAALPWPCKQSREPQDEASRKVFPGHASSLRAAAKNQPAAVGAHCTAASKEKENGGKQRGRRSLHNVHTRKTTALLLRPLIHEEEWTFDRPLPNSFLPIAQVTH